MLQVDTQPKDDGSLLHKRQELQREVEQTKRALAQQVGMAEIICVVIPMVVTYAMST